MEKVVEILGILFVIALAIIILVIAIPIAVVYMSFIAAYGLVILAIGGFVVLILSVVDNDDKKG